jgi:hypothetical protein
VAGPVLLSCEALTKSFTSRPLFENLGFTISEGDHVGRRILARRFRASFRATLRVAAR